MLSDNALDHFRHNTGSFIKNVFEEDLEDYSQNICDLVDKHDRIAIKACHAVGKTFTGGRIVAALLNLNPNTIIITTAPTFRQVKDLLWSEIHTAAKKIPASMRMGRLNQVEWEIAPGWIAKGFSPQVSAAGETGQGTNSVFQGYHGKYMTIVFFDEATGVDPQLWDQAEGLLNTGKVKFICIANPTSRNSNFFRCFSDRTWATYSITCFDSPNLKINGIYNKQDMLEEKAYLDTLSDDDYRERLNSYKIVKPHLISLKWVMSKLHVWGIDHPLFKGKVLGEFPDTDDNALISLETVQAAQSLEVEPLDSDMRYIGVDVARYGIDSSVFTDFIGWKQVGYEKYHKADTTVVAGSLIRFIKESSEYGYRRTRVAIDGGFGHGVIDLMIEAKEKGILDDTVEIIEFNFGARDWVKWHYGWKDEKALRDPMLATDRKVQEERENYANYKAKMFDLLARDLKTKISLFPNSVYLNELPSIIMLPYSDGVLKIESKDDYKKRTGENSPDSADSLALANVARYFAVKPLSMLDALQQSEND